MNIFGTYVEKEYRGKGIGHKLMESVIKNIQKNVNVSKIELNVNPEQKAAVKLYEKYGFELVGRLEKGLKIDDKFYDELIMERHLYRTCARAYAYGFLAFLPNLRNFFRARKIVLSSD